MTIFFEVFLSVVAHLFLRRSLSGGIVLLLVVLDDQLLGVDGDLLPQENSYDGQVEGGAYQEEVVYCPGAV